MGLLNVFPYFQPKDRQNFNWYLNLVIVNRIQFDKSQGLNNYVSHCMDHISQKILKSKTRKIEKAWESRISQKLKIGQGHPFRETLGDDYWLVMGEK